MTGLYPLHTGVFTNCKNASDIRLRDDDLCIGQVLSDNGYDTGYIGKWHLDGCRYKVDIDRTAFWIIPRERRGRFQTFLGYDNNNMQYDCYIHGHRRDEEVPLTRLPGYETDDLSELLMVLTSLPSPIMAPKSCV